MKLGTQPPSRTFGSFRLNVYEDKLDGVIDEAFFARKAEEMRAEQARLAEAIEKHRRSTPGHIDDVLQLANRAAELFEQQPATEKTKLLKYVVQECRWSNSTLTYEWQPPFEEYAEAQAPKAA